MEWKILPKCFPYTHNWHWKKTQSIFVSHSQSLNHSIELLWSSYCLPREGPIFIPPPGFPLTQQLHCHLGRKPKSKHCFIWSTSVLKKYPSSLSILLPSEKAGCCFCEEWLPPFDSRALWSTHAKQVALLLPRITVYSTLQWHPCFSFPFHMRIWKGKEPLCAWQGSNMLPFCATFKITESNFVEREECSNSSDPTLPEHPVLWNLQSAPLLQDDWTSDVPDVLVQNFPFFFTPNFTVGIPGYYLIEPVLRGICGLTP